MNGCRIHGDSNRHRDDEESGYTEGVGSNYTELAGEKHCRVGSNRSQDCRHRGTFLGFCKGDCQCQLSAISGSFQGCNDRRKQKLEMDNKQKEVESKAQGKKTDISILSSVRATKWAGVGGRKGREEKRLTWQRSMESFSGQDVTQESDERFIMRGSVGREYVVEN